MDKILTETRGRKPLSGNSSEPSKRVYVWLTETMLARLDSAAKANETDRASEIRVRLAESLDSERQRGAE